MGEANVVRRVAMACLGGGSHTAFTAGVLKRLLRAEELAGYEVVGLSGTSGGAVCALLAWHKLLRGDAAGAVDALDAFWRDNSATTLLEQVVNSWTVWASNLQNFVGTPAISPYDNYFSILGLEEFKRMLERRIDFRKDKCAAGRILPCTVGRGRGRAQRRVSDLQQQTGHNLRRDHPGLGCHLDTLSLRASRRWGDLLGRALLAKPPGK